MRVVTELTSIVDPSEYLDLLNHAFTGYGSSAVFSWMYDRCLPPDPPADIILFRDGKKAVAGSGISYRSVSLRGAAPLKTGIMMNSWTDPSARGLGYFSRAIQTSSNIARAKGCTLLLAFVTQSNSSSRQLKKAGAGTFPTSYLVFHGDAIINKESVIRSIVRAQEITANLCEQKTTHARPYSILYYQTAKEWRSQLVERPWPVETIEFPNNTLAYIETHGVTDRVNAILAPSQEQVKCCIAALVLRSIATSRKLFLYSTINDITAFCMSVGFHNIPGYLTVIILDKPSLNISLQPNGPDDAVTEVALADPLSTHYIGPWNIQSGDRM